MKTLTLTIITAFILLTTAMKAQLTLQYTFDSTQITNPYCTDIGNNEFKFVFMNPAKNSFSLYNMDMTPYMLNIQIPPTGDSIKNGYEVFYISKTLFDCDSTNIEYVYSDPIDIYKTFYIYRTNGTLLLKMDSANGPYCAGCWGGSFYQAPVMNTSSGTKLFLQKYGPLGVPEMMVYSMCGKLPETVFNFPGRGQYVKIYPNPASMVLNFEIDAPNNHEEFQLIIIDETGKECSRANISASQNKFTMDVSKLSSGTYIYTLTTPTKTYQTGKFVITK